MIKTFIALIITILIIVVTPYLSIYLILEADLNFIIDSLKDFKYWNAIVAIATIGMIGASLFIHYRQENIAKKKLKNEEDKKKKNVLRIIYKDLKYIDDNTFEHINNTLITNYNGIDKIFKNNKLFSKNFYQIMLHFMEEAKYFSLKKPNGYIFLTLENQFYKDFSELFKQINTDIFDNLLQDIIILDEKIMKKLLEIYNKIKYLINNSNHGFTENQENDLLQLKQNIDNALELIKTKIDI